MPRVTGRLTSPGRGKLPSLEKMKAMTPEQLIATLDRFGLAPDVKAFERAARQVYEQQLEAAIEGKGFPDAETWKAIDAQLERTAKGVLRRQTKQTVHRYRKQRLATVARYFVWIAVGRGSCPSCLGRHGKRKTMRQWEALGEPGSAVLICQQECRCSLVPDVVGQAEPDDGVDEAVDAAISELEQVEVGVDPGRALKKPRAPRKQSPLSAAVARVNELGVIGLDPEIFQAGMRDPTYVNSAYAGATPEQVEAIAAGKAPTMNTKSTQWAKPFEPITVVVNDDGTQTVRDGRHRTQAAIAAGAEKILAKVIAPDGSEKVTVVRLKPKGK